MASKQFARTSSQGEIGQFNNRQVMIPMESPTRPPAKVKGGGARTMAPKTTSAVHREYYSKRTPTQQQQQQPPPERVIFTVGSPEREIISHKSAKKVDEGFGVFLQACSLCKKKLQPDKDIYMYGFLGAFCSVDCRDDRIALDGMDTKEVVKVLPSTMAPSKRFR